jgi:hypothetical protein
MSPEAVRASVARVMSSNFRCVAFIGDHYVRKQLRESVGTPFSPVHHAAESGACVIATAVVGETVFADLDDDWADAPAAARTSSLVALGVDLLVVGYSAGHGVARALTEARRAGVADVVGVLRTGTHSPAEADALASATAERDFAEYAAWILPAPPRTLLRTDDSPWRLLTAFLAAQQPSARLAPDPSRHVLACATCGAPVTSPVAIVSWSDIGQRWATKDGDESLVPPGCAVLGHGEKPRSWTFREGFYYVHEADLVRAEDNGRGIQITCCGARPDPSNGPNLACPAGHPIGELWTDCCSPQGGHLDAARVLVR